jgi:hypothetical protein
LIFERPGEHLPSPSGALCDGAGAHRASLRDGYGGPVTPYSMLDAFLSRTIRLSLSLRLGLNAGLVRRALLATAAALAWIGSSAWHLSDCTSLSLNVAATLATRSK